MVFVDGFPEGDDPFALGEFKPDVFYNEDLQFTEIVLEDTMIVWHQWQPPGMPKGHVVDLGYNQDGLLVGIKLWGDVRKPVSD